MTTRGCRSRRHRSRKVYRGARRGRTIGKKWTTAIEAAQKTLSKTGSLTAARKTLKKQALTNARKLFGSVSGI
jgi:hypothetical protein